MTSEELRAHMARINEITIELDVIMGKIQDHQTELETLWKRYWELFHELTDIDLIGGAE